MYVLCLLICSLTAQHRGQRVKEQHVLVPNLSNMAALIGDL